MGFYLAIPILLLASAIQSAVFPQFRIASGQPDLVFLLVVLWSANAKLDEAIFWAFVGGMMQDLLSILPLGASSFMLLVIVFAITTFSEQIYRINILILLLFVVVGNLLYQLFLQFVLSIMGNGISLLDALQYVITPSLVYNLIILIPLYIIIRIIQRAIPRRGPAY